MKLQQLVQSFSARHTRRKEKEIPQIVIGDTVRVAVYIQEGNKQRLQPYAGTVIAQHKARTNSTITVRRVFQGIGVERVFTVASPSLHSIELIRRAKVRRAKLYYLRHKVGKATRLVTKLRDNISEMSRT